MRKAISLLLFTAIAFQTLGWGPTGHRVTGFIADKYLNNKARKALARILNGQSLAMASTWMDEVRSDSAYDHMADWHFVNIPEGLSYRQSEKNPKGDILVTLERVIAALRSPDLSQDQEIEHLRILIHFTGDLHQPLHVSARPDKGGNEVQVMWFRNPSNLHRVWDSDMIDDSRLSYTELAESLDTPTQEQLRSWQQSTIYDWARESQSYNEQVYDYGSGHLGYRYSYLNFPVVRLRLLQAGVRLAGILNELYG